MAGQTEVGWTLDSTETGPGGARPALLTPSPAPGVPLSKASRPPPPPPHCPGRLFAGLSVLPWQVPWENDGFFRTPPVPNGQRANVRPQWREKIALAHGTECPTAAGGTSGSMGQPVVSAHECSLVFTALSERDTGDHTRVTPLRGPPRSNPHGSAGSLRGPRRGQWVAGGTPCRGGKRRRGPGCLSD